MFLFTPPIAHSLKKKQTSILEMLKSEYFAHNTQRIRILILCQKHHELLYKPSDMEAVF